MLGEPICVSTLSSHCRGPFRCSSIQQGVLVTVWRLKDTERFDYSSPENLKKTTWLTTYNWGWLCIFLKFPRFLRKGMWYLTHTPHAVPPPLSLSGCLKYVHLPLHVPCILAPLLKVLSLTNSCRSDTLPSHDPPFFFLSISAVGARHKQIP